MSKGTPVAGNQIIVEGLVGDILNEHFGEAVELVGIVLLRNGGMTFPEIVRVCSMNFLAFPREILNFYNEYSKATFSTDSVSYKSIRDSLLVMIHHGIVSVSSNGVYSLNSIEVFNRLLFPLFLDQFEGAERFAMEQLLKRSMVKKDVLIRELKQECVDASEVVDALQQRRTIITADSIVRSPEPNGTSGDSLVVRFNSVEVQLCVLKQHFAEYVESHYGEVVGRIVKELLTTVIARSDQDSSVSFRSRISIGDLSVSDMAKRLDMGNNELISSLIKLQQAGVVSKKQSGAPSPAPEVTKAATGRKRKAAPAPRARNTKQLLAMVESEEDDGGDFKDLIGERTTSGATAGGVPSYSVRFFEVLEEMESEITFQLIKAKYGVDGARIFELLSTSKQKYEASHIADICAISREDALRYVHSFARDGLGHIQEVPKVITSTSAATSGGIAAMMRAVASSFWLYSSDEERVRRAMISLTCNSIVNLRRRFRHEVNRQCRIEDRASLLTKAEQQYLETVHAAQDILEASSIQLVSSLLILLLRT